MKKIKLYSIGNNGKFNHYVLEKTNEGMNSLLKLINEIFNIDFPLWRDWKNKDGKIKSRKIVYGNMKDKYFSDSDNNTVVDLFLGDKRLFISINCTLTKRKKFHDKLFEFVEIQKPKKKKTTSKKK
jgi:hypothetical protein